MFQDVTCELKFDSKGLLAYVTFKWPFTRMDAFVLHESSVTPEGLLAVGTLIILLL